MLPPDVHDAEGAPPSVTNPHAMAVHVRGGVGHGHYDTDELAGIAARLDAVQRAGMEARSALDAVRRGVDLDANLAPPSAGRVHTELDEAIYGPCGVEHLRAETFELLVALRYARMLYEEAELAATTDVPVPSPAEYLRVLGDPFDLPRVIGATVGAAHLVGRLSPSTSRRLPGRITAAYLEAVNWVIGDDNLPPDSIALDRAVRELGDGGQHILPWFLVPRPFSYDGRHLDTDDLTTTQRLLVPLTAAWHALGQRRPAAWGGPDVLRTSPPRSVAPARDLAGTVRALHAIHIADGAAPGSIQLRRADHPDGHRSWTVMLPSTQSMALGGSNPVDNLTNIETYGGLISDVEIGAARAMELAGIAPGEDVAVVGFSQGGLVAMRLAADPLVRSRYAIRAVVTAGSPVGHLPTPQDTEVLNLEHLEDMFVGLDGTANPEELHRTTVSRALTTGEDGELDFRVPMSRAHSIDAYAQTAELALATGDASVSHLDDRVREITGGPGARVTAMTFQLERSAEP